MQFPNIDYLLSEWTPLFRTEHTISYSFFIWNSANNYCTLSSYSDWEFCCCCCYLKTPLFIPRTRRRSLIFRISFFLWFNFFFPIISFSFTKVSFSCDLLLNWCPTALSKIYYKSYSVSLIDIVLVVVASAAVLYRIEPQTTGWHNAELTGWMEFVATRLNYRRFSGWNSFGCGNRFASGLFIREHLLDAASLLFSHLIVTGIEEFLLLVSEIVKWHWLAICSDIISITFIENTEYTVSSFLLIIWKHW